MFFFLSNLQLQQAHFTEQPTQLVAEELLASYHQDLGDSLVASKKAKSTEQKNLLRELALARYALKSPDPVVVCQCS